MSTDAPLGYRRLPAWALALIVFVVVSYLSFFCGGIGLIFLAKKEAARALNPLEVAKIAEHIAKFPNQLPPGFVFVFGFQVGPVNIVTIEHQPDKQEITIASESQERALEAKLALKEAYDTGINLPSTKGWPSNTHFKSTKHQGTLEIAHEQMPYLVGELQDIGGKSMEGFLACVSPKQLKRTILIFGLQPNGGPYKVEQTLDLLRCLSGF